MRSTVQATFTLLVLSANACMNPGQPSDPDPSANIVSVQGVKVTPQTVQLLALGDTRQLLATVSPANATDQAIVWESTDSSVVSVDAVGLVTAKAAGSGVIITVYTHDGRHQASVNVSVNPWAVRLRSAKSPSAAMTAERQPSSPPASESFLRRPA
jgi:uncharacterized protein YjdB